MSGKVYGVGVGPGDPELMTVKAARILGSVPILAWPAPLEGDSFARSIAAPHLKPGQREIAIRMPMVEARFPAAKIYDAAAEEVIAAVQDGHDVAVLCEGDPFFYGSFMYLFARLADRVEIEIIPGVSSLTATAAAAQFPLCSRNDVLTVLPAPIPEEILKKRIEEADAVAFVKIGRHLPKVRRLLEAANMADKARYIQHASLKKQQQSFLSELPKDHSAPYFSMILAHRSEEAWLENLNPDARPA